MKSLIQIELGVQTDSGPFVSVPGVLDEDSQVTSIPENIVKQFDLKIYPKNAASTSYSANFLLNTRDGGTAILDGFEVLVPPIGNMAIVGRDLLSRFSYRINDRRIFLLNQIRY